KADGRQRPLGIATLEDKIVQRAVVEVLNAVYEVDFLGFSYGFRPRRSPHHALDALTVGIERKKVNWVLDADIRDFFTSLDHGWLEKFLEHRIADKRVLRLISKWLNAGGIENATRTVMSSSCASRTTSLPGSSIRRTRSSSSLIFASGSRSSAWSCILAKRALSSSAGRRPEPVRPGVTGNPRRSTSLASRTCAARRRTAVSG